MQTEEKPRAIVTYGRSLMALMIAQSLDKIGVDVYGCDSVDMTVMSFSKAVRETALYCDPNEDEMQFIEDLVGIAKRYNAGDDRPYVLMASFNEAKIIARHKDRFEGIVTVAIPDYDVIDKIDPKDHFAKTCDDVGAYAPQTVPLKSQEAAKKAAQKLGYPFFLKAPDEVGGRGVYKVENEEELLKAYKDVQSYKGTPMAQEMAAGEDYCFCGMYDRGTLKASMVYHNNRKFPNVSGAGVMRETVDSKMFDKIANDLMGPLAWHGVVEIDFMWDGDDKNKPMMIEVNPRFWMGLDHSVRSGVDFPALLFQLYAGKRLTADKEPKVGYQSKLPVFPVLSDVQNFLTNSFDFSGFKGIWGDLSSELKEGDIGGAFDVFKGAFEDSISIGDSYQDLKASLKEVDKAEPLDMHKDDPFIGLGVLFVLSFLLRHGSLPPELTR
jgi:predicted ATP-grasp superfamily ATP-dependent carboligase